MMENYIKCAYVVLRYRHTLSTDRSTVIFWLTEIMTVHKHLVHCVGFYMTLHSYMKKSYIMSVLITW